MRDDPSVIALVSRAGAGDQRAWNEIVERYAPLVWSICMRYRLERHDIDDVNQSVWLLLVEKIGGLREPAALPGWLATTTARECLRVLRSARRHDHAELPAVDQLPPDPDAPMIDQEILAAERDARVRAAFAELPRPCRELLSLMISDPPCHYADISVKLGIAMGSIGPTRSRCLARLRQSKHLADIAGGAANSGKSTQGVSAVADGWDDEELLVTLNRALTARRAVPPELVEAGKSAFAWHNIDAELARLTYDSIGGLEHAAPTRSEGASIRALTFTSAHLTIELEVTGDSLLGQVVPAQSAMIEVQTGASTDTAIRTDDIGCFSICPIPGGAFRLHCRASAGLDVLTGWITL